MYLFFSRKLGVVLEYSIFAQRNLFYSVANCNLYVEIDVFVVNENLKHEYLSLAQ